jgi:hypothetical protein
MDGNRKSLVLCLLAVTACLLSCGGPGNQAAPAPKGVQKPAGVLANARYPLTTPTFDGSGQGMHPGIVHFEMGWHGYTHWMSLTPYPESNASLENPSVLASNDGLNWEVPAGLVNPVATPSGVHMDDPDLMYDDASDQLWIYYLEEDRVGKTHVWRKTSADGTIWSEAIDVLTVPNYRVVSPALLRTAAGYGLYTINAGGEGCSAASTTVEYRTSSDGIEWSSPQTVNLVQPGYTIWHIDVSYIPPRDEYWAVYAAYPAQPGKACGDSVLFLAESKDGLTWTTHRRALLMPGNSWDSSEIYRSTVLYEPATENLRLWYSGASSYVWHTGYAERRFSDTLAALDQ